MPVQNLVSAALTPEAKAEVLQKLADIKSKLNFLITLQPLNFLCNEIKKSRKFFLTNFF